MIDDLTWASGALMIAILAAFVVWEFINRKYDE